jgi:acetylornithine deacetylase/succinyl-diaminopimelate desuccinylase-like protein
MLIIKRMFLKSAEYVNELFSSLGLETKIATSGNSRPAVLAQTDIDPTKKTILLYAHHDVQPVGDIDKWKKRTVHSQSYRWKIIWKRFR